MDIFPIFSLENRLVSEQKSAKIKIAPKPRFHSKNVIIWKKIDVLMIFGCFQARGTPKNNICCIWTAIAKAFGESQKSWFLAFWYQKMNLSFKMWFFGLKSIKIVSFDQKLHFVQKNCLKNALGRVYEKFNFGSFGHFWHFLLFSCLKVGWITQQNNEKIEPSKTRFYCGFLADIALIFTKNEFLMTFWVPRSPVVPQKQHIIYDVKS